MTPAGLTTDFEHKNLTEDRADAKAAMDAERAEAATMVTVTATATEAE
jgi:hypothetical protein